MKIQGYGRSDVGRQRRNNEDVFHVDNDLGLFVACDGMGGHQAGEVASRIAVETVARELSAKRELLADAATGVVTSAVADAIRAANEAIFRRAEADPELKGMGCVLTLLLARGGTGFVGHVGDTRLYVYRDGKAELLSRDHTMVAELVRSGVVSPEDQDRVPHAHALTRAVGSQETVEVDVSVSHLRAGDRFLLCSDGLSGYVKDTALLARQLGAPDVAAIPEVLVKWANEAGGRDNVTAVVVSVDA